MKAVMPSVSPDLLQWRKRTGAERWDEMWEGVLHMPPAPNPWHQDFQGSLETWLRTYWCRPHGSRVFHDVNLAPPGGWPKNYRIPDLLLLTPDRLHTLRDEHFEGAPTAVVEIRSPGDETLEKLPFYAALGVPEVWILDRDTRAVELHVLSGGVYQSQPPTADGWFTSPATGIRLRPEASRKLALQRGDDPDTLALLPED